MNPTLMVPSTYSSYELENCIFMKTAVEWLYLACSGIETEWSHLTNDPSPNGPIDLFVI